MIQVSFPDEAKTISWIAAIGIAAFNLPSALEATCRAIDVQGWYTAWLRFAIRVSLAFARLRDERSKSEQAVCDALAELSIETSPFRGSPRACDLYSIRHEISAVWKKTLSILSSPTGIAEGLRHLSRISASTTTYLQGSPHRIHARSTLLSYFEACRNATYMASGLSRVDCWNASRIILPEVQPGHDADNQFPNLTRCSRKV
jgi:hypothetical protein